MRLSIITINRNNAEGLEKTIQSVINQTFTDFEYIVIDGASSDKSIEIISDFESKISYWISEPDSGIYNAMNKGIKRATGEYLLFLNSGDYLYSTKTLKEVFSENQNADLLYGHQFRIGRKNRIKKFPSELSFYLFYVDFLGHNSTFIKRSLFEKTGLYSEHYKIVSDMEFLVLAVCKYNCTYKFIDNILSIMEDGGISNNDSSKEIVEKERASVFQKHFPAFVPDYNELYQLKFNSISKRIKRKIKSMLKINK